MIALALGSHELAGPDGNDALTLQSLQDLQRARQFFCGRGHSVSFLVLLGFCVHHILGYCVILLLGYDVNLLLGYCVIYHICLIYSVLFVIV